MLDFGNLLARLLLTILFFVSAAGKLVNVAGIANAFSTRGFPLPTASGYAFAAIEGIAALMVLFGYRARLGALILVLLTAGTILISHNYWDMEGLDRVRNQTHALKNLAIIGGLLMLAIAGPGRFSLRRAA